MTQILRNLLSNALKFTERGEVTLSVAPATAACCASTCAIPASASRRDKLDMIFEAFQQADGSTSRQYGGSGLGLSISREFSRLLGGRITVASEVGKGSVFTLWLPLDAEAALAASANASSVPPSAFTSAHGHGLVQAQAQTQAQAQSSPTNRPAAGGIARSRR